MYRIGLDVGSTTAKLVALNEKNEIIYKSYRRHKANVGNVLKEISSELKNSIGEEPFQFAVTGSVALGLSEKCGFQFVQEVVAATEFTKRLHPEVSTIIDIGGEDAKIVYLKDGRVSDLRMNGNCAGGTGAFIDQMAMCLGVEVTELDGLAKNSKTIYPIASRCGVFSKTDIQNLIARNVSKEDIASSIFRAVAVQTASALSHGCSVTPKIMLCGGPLSFIPSLRKAVADYFNLNLESDFVQIEDGGVVPAYGTALSANSEKTFTVDSILKLILESEDAETGKNIYAVSLPILFNSENEYSTWLSEKQKNDVRIAGLAAAKNENVFLGIDSGSTTTKIVLTNKNGDIIYKYYAHNGGNPIGAVKTGLEKIAEDAKAAGVEIKIAAACSTGYGEDLMRAAFSLDHGIIETMAHYLAARTICPQVSFILDIGGQDMKAIYVDGKTLTRIEINEACSSGCGSFIETFAQTLSCSVQEFAKKACFSKEPCDLGTRCTVFMNSKVKQALREGHSLSDISAGLAYSVVKNCLFKVLKIRNYSELGKGVVLQGGTMKNDAVVRAFEKLIGRDVYRNNIPEVMGAYGCALYAASEYERSNSKAKNKPRAITELMTAADYETKELRCGGCENKCQIMKYIFKNGESYFSGNKCERIFNNGKPSEYKGVNLSGEKYKLLFDRSCKAEQLGGGTKDSRGKIGIPRVLNMYEEYPFWNKLFTKCGFDVVLSSTSTISAYEKGVHSVMSDNICFPAKLVHGHIYELEGKVDRIFFPRVVHERSEGKNESYSFNCPVIIGYPDVVDSAIQVSCPVDSPIIAFKDTSLLRKQLHEYLIGLGVDDRTIDLALLAAFDEWEKFGKDIRELNEKILAEAKKAGRMVILLAGRPYHTDPLVQHNISDMIASLGVDVITEEIGRSGNLELQSGEPEAFHIRQFTFVDRILNAAQWAAEQDSNVHFVEITSFGCGPDAFLTDEVRNILVRHGKPLTLLKVDDVNNIGSLKLRVRSLIDSLTLSERENEGERKFKKQPFIKTAMFQKGDKKRKTLLAPFFTEYMSPLLPAAFKAVGFDLVALPMGDAESNEEGLRYSNNEVCYPATIIVGDFIKALKSGKYDLNNTALVLTQLGQCRATNYPNLIKRALVEAGFEMVPMISIGGLDNDEHPGFKLNFFKAGPLAMDAVLFGDWLSIFYHAIAIREIKKGEAKRIREKYMKIASRLLEKGWSKSLIRLLARASKEFNAVETDNKVYPKAGINGEIFLKFNPFSHKHIADWLMAHGVEVCPPTMHNYFLKSLVNAEFNTQTKIKQGKLPKWAMNFIYKTIYKRIGKFEHAASKFKYFQPHPDIRTIAKWAEEVISLSVQGGEGWLLPGETIEYIKLGCNNVVSLQPFGCIANHIAARGIEKKMKELYPQLNHLALDYDGGVSEANIANRLQLFVSNMEKPESAAS